MMRPPIAYLRPEVYRWLEMASGLPSPKGAALALLRLAEKEDVTLAEMARVVQTDPALVGRLIKVANSSQSGAHRPVAAAQDAMVVLGLRTVRYLALSFSLVSDHRHGRCAAFDYSHFWSHSLALGVASRAFAEHTHCAPAEEMFSVGLLARIGELALATIYPERYAEVLEKARRGEGAQRELEREAFALCHAELSAAMLADWGLPELFAAAVLFHERPAEADFAPESRAERVLGTLCLARATADVCTAAEGERRALLAPLWRAASKFSLAGEELSALCDRIVKEWQEWARLLSIESRQVPPFAEIDQESAADSDHGAPAEREEAEPAAPFRALLALSAADAERFTRWFNEAGFVVRRAQSADEALSLALEWQPELILIDVGQTGDDGYAVVGGLRRTRIGRSIYLIVAGEAIDEARAYESGADDAFITSAPARLVGARLRSARRLLQLQREVERDREEIRRFAAELALANQRLQKAALTDVLTGLPNRRYALQRFEQEWRVANRNDSPLSCLLIDVDHFKQINDGHGHEIGDRVLRDIALAMRRQTRARDVLCRYAGDEFLVISPDTPFVEAQVCAERLRRAVAALAWPLPSGTTLRCSVSIGVATRSKETPDIDSLIRLADQGAYRAKEHGRDRVGSIQK